MQNVECRMPSLKSMVFIFFCAKPVKQIKNMREKSLKLLIAFLFLAAFFAESAAQAQVRYRKLTFKDEFNGASGAGVDTTKWTSETGGGGWGNQELQYYTNSTENAYLDGSGSLVIKAVKLT